MDRGQGARERVTQLGGALDAALAGSTGLAGVKGRAQDSVGELRPRAAVVRLGLGALDLELIEDAGHFGDLLLVQIELVRQEAQRAAHAPAAAGARLPFERVAPLVAVARHLSSSPITAVARAVAFRRAVVEKVETQVGPGAPREVAPGISPPRRGVAVPAGNPPRGPGASRCSHLMRVSRRGQCPGVPSSYEEGKKSASKPSLGKRLFG